MKMLSRPLCLLLAFFWRLETARPSPFQCHGKFSLPDEYCPYVGSTLSSILLPITKCELCPALSDYLCVYTDASFTGGRGITLVTTPSIINRTIQRHHAVGSVAAVVPDEPYMEHKIPGKGTGLVANRLIKKGEIVISEPPTMVIHLDANAVLSKQKRLAMQWEGLYELPEKIRLRTLELAGSLGGDHIDDLFETNSFGIALGDSVIHRGLFLQISRLNHDCRPNCLNTFDPGTLRQNIYAVRDVRPGEEITISYTHQGMNREERQQATRSWGFNCSCQACALTEDETWRSDDRVRRIGQYVTELEDWSEDSRVTPTIAEDLIFLYEEEGLFCELATGFRLAAQAYNAVGDRFNAMRYGAKAIEHGLMAWIDKGDMMQDTLQLLVDSEHHWTWMRRLRLSV